jgi:hypothetical protein
MRGSGSVPTAKRLEFHSRNRPNAQPKHTSTLSLDGPAAGRHIFGTTIRPGAIRGMAIWEIPAYIMLADRHNHWMRQPIP